MTSAGTASGHPAVGSRVKSPAVKRILKEAQEAGLNSGPGQEWSAAPLEDNVFEWHFTVRGAADTDYEGGVYHGRILLPAEYPMKPPHIIMLTPSGRFEVNRKICLSISGHHPETWQPSWSVRTALLALVAFMPTPGEGSVGSLDYAPKEKRALAAKSRSFRCPRCGPVDRLLPPLSSAESPSPATTAEPERAEAVSRIPTVERPKPRSEDVPSETDRHPLDTLRDVLLLLLAIAVAIFFYRRSEAFRVPLRS